MSPQCIYIIKSDDKKPRLHGQAAVLSEGVRDIDISVCMSLPNLRRGLPFEAIKMDKDFELSKRERFDALLFPERRAVEVERVLSPIHPVEQRRGREPAAAAAAAGSEEKSSGRGGKTRSVFCRGRYQRPRKPTASYSTKTRIDVGSGESRRRFVHEDVRISAPETRSQALGRRRQLQRRSTLAQYI